MLINEIKSDSELKVIAFTSSSFLTSLINTMDSKRKNKDYFSIFVNWFSSLGSEKPSINQISGGQDFFSKLMNRISG